MAQANYHATGQPPKRDFQGGINTPCFQTFERLGFELKAKGERRNTPVDLHAKLITD